MIVRLGPSRLLRSFTAAVLVVAWYLVFVGNRVALANPIDIGSDTSNYYAAGLRLLTGHDLYALSAGDRPVLADLPPFFSVPLLSPPPIAAIWRLLAVLPGAPLMYGWWLAGAMLVTATVGTLVARVSPRGFVPLILLSLGAATVALSGNLNAFLLPMIPLVWVSSERHPAARRWLVAAGVLAGLGAGLKLTPVILVWWLACRGRSTAVVSAVIALVGVLALSLAIAGSAAFVDYVAISRTTVEVGAQPWSVTRMLGSLGVGGQIASLGPIMVAAAIGLGVWILRGRPAASFVLAVIGVLFASPVVRFDSLALLVGALAPWAWPADPVDGGEGPVFRRLRMIPPPLHSILPVGFAVLGLVLYAGSVARAPVSSAYVENGSDEPIVVRFGGIYGTFGFELGPRSSGSAWTTIPGGLTGWVFVFDGSCRRLDATGPGWIEGAASVSVSEPLTMTVGQAGPTDRPALAFSHRCAAEAEP